MHLFRSRMTINDLAEEFILEKQVTKAVRTAGNYHWRLGKFQDEFGERYPKDIKRADLQRFVLNLRQNSGLSDTSINGVIQAIKTFFNWMQRNGYINENVHHAIHRTTPRDTRKDKPTNAKTFKLMLKNSLNQRDKVILHFAADTAARRGEIATLMMRNIDYEHLRALVTGKTGTRWVTFTKPMANMLKDYIDNHRPKEATHDYVFTTLARPWRPLKPPSITAACSRIRTRLIEQGIECGPTNPHAFRHWVCQEYARAGDVNLAKLKLGHAHIATTMWYVHNDVEFLQSKDPGLSVLNLLDDNEEDEDKATDKDEAIDQDDAIDEDKE